MDLSDRQKQIIDRLRPKPISHGQLDTSIIAVPEFQSDDISPDRRQAIRNSLEEQGINLFPIIVRRTEAYYDEEYEVVYGADWCWVAKELDIPKLWVWVFDMTDEQAAAAKTEMEQLLGFSSNIQKTESEQPKQVVEPLIQSETTEDIQKTESEQPKQVVEPLIQSETTEIDEMLLDKKLQPITALLNQLLSKANSSRENLSEERLNGIDRRLDRLTSTVERLVDVVDKLISPQPQPKVNLQLVTEIKTENTQPKIEEADKQIPLIQSSKLNLKIATKAEIERALEKVGAKPNQIKAAWKAIEHWKTSSRVLTWKNLDKSTKSGADKIKEFATATYQKLREIGDILD